MQAQQLSIFLSAARDPLATVTSLKLRLPKSNSRVHAPTPPTHGSSLLQSCILLPTRDPYGLSALAGLCPAARHLSVDGCVSHVLLQCLGSTLTSFEFHASHMPASTIERFHEALPNVTTISIQGYSNKGPSGPSAFISGCDLSRMTGVRHLKVSELHIHTDLIWDSLPPNLVSLSCAGVHLAPPSSVSLKQLQCLHLTGPACTLKALAGLFQSAPALLKVTAVTATLQVNSGLASGGPLEQTAIATLAADLTLLDSRHKACVALFSYAVVFEDCEGLLTVLQRVSVLPAFTQLALDWVSVHMSAQLLELLGSVFPNMDTLELSDSETVDDRMLMSLLPLRNLKQFTVRSCPLVTVQVLTFLCCQLPSLQVLTCIDLEGVSKEQTQLLEAMMTAIGRHFVLVFEHEAAG